MEEGAKVGFLIIKYCSTERECVLIITVFLARPIIQEEFKFKMKVLTSPNSLLVTHDRPVNQEARCWGKE